MIANQSQNGSKVLDIITEGKKSTRSCIQQAGFIAQDPAFYPHPRSVSVRISRSYVKTLSILEARIGKCSYREAAKQSTPPYVDPMSSYRSMRVGHSLQHCGVTIQL